MLQSLFNAMFGCTHQRTTFPQTPGRNKNATYVVCLDCGKEFAYNWNDMRVGQQVVGQAIDFRRLSSSPTTK
jgi:hypothetical protein